VGLAATLVGVIGSWPIGQQVYTAGASNLDAPAAVSCLSQSISFGRQIFLGPVVGVNVNSLQESTGSSNHASAAVGNVC